MVLGTSSGSSRVPASTQMTDANLEEFFKTIHDLGYDEYVGYFIDYYENIYKADK